jgi:8-oxo-dGTP pyrophosphatase MutT (NUDIX family)
VVDLKNYWRLILEKLPLVAAEGVEYTEAAFSHLLESMGDDPCERATLYIAQEVFRKSGVLDSDRLAEGRWRFVSYPARLFACSLLSLMANDESFFSRDFWSSDKNSDSSGQYSVLHALETLRYGTDERAPIRRTYVAWGIIKRCGMFVLKRRENRGDDPDNAAHGSYVFPGGRLNMGDLGACGSSMPEREKLALLYGIPRQLTDSDGRVLRSALECTLKRELQEELGLIHGTHYEFSVSPVQSPPRTFVHGANGQHCITENLITFYEIHLSPKGDAFLASKCDEEELFTIDEMIVGQPNARKVFYDFSDKNFENYIRKLDDSASRFEIKQPVLSSSAARVQKAAACATLILPIERGQPVLLGDLEITVDDQKYIELLLLLGLNARFNIQLRLHAGVAENKRWGWLKLNPSLLETARSLDMDIKKNHCVSPMLLSESMCRLNVAEENIFFSPSLFSAELSADKLIITRQPIYCREIFELDRDFRSASLTEPNMEHLRNLLSGRSDLVAYDNLRKITTRGNQRLDDFVCQFGLLRLYEPINDSFSKGHQEFRFSVQMRHKQGK